MRGFGIVSNFLLNIGHSNVVAADKIISIVNPNSEPIKRLRSEASERGLLVDATQGKRTLSIIVMSSGHIIESFLGLKALTDKFNAIFGYKNYEDDHH